MVKIKYGPLICLERKHKLAYVNAPLNGCTTIKTMLIHAQGHYEVPYTKVHEIFSEQVNIDGLNIINHLSYIPDDYFTFTAVRNPFDRLVSFYKGKWMLREGKDEPPLYHEYKPYDWNQSFPEFVEWLDDYGLENVEHHLMTQYDNLKVAELDNVVRFENFAHDLELVLSLNNVDFDDIPNLAQKPRKDDYSGYYNYQAKELVKKLYRIDLKRLGYEF